MMTLEQLKDELRKIIKDENITTSRQLCKSSTVNSLISNCIYDKMINIISKVDDFIYDKIMKDYYSRLDYYFENELEDNYEEKCSITYSKIHDFLEDYAVRDAASELYNEVHHFLSEIKKIIYQVISETSSTKKDASKFQKCIEKLIDNGIKHYVSCENVDVSDYEDFEYGIIDYFYFSDIVGSTFEDMYDIIYQDILDRREKEYEEKREEFISHVEDMDINSM